MGKGSQVSAGARASAVSFCLSHPLASRHVAVGIEAPANEDFASPLGVPPLFEQLWKYRNSLGCFHGGVSQVSLSDFPVSGKRRFSWPLSGSSAAMLHCHFNGTANNETRSAECSSGDPHTTSFTGLRWLCQEETQRDPLLPPLKIDSVLMEAAVISSHLSCQT